MGLTATDGGGGDFTPAPQGTHVARCVRVIDIGTQPGSMQFPKPRQKVIISWELPDELHEYEGEQVPFLVHKRYTMSLHENAALRHDLESWRGRQFTETELSGFHLKNIAGVACMVTITHSTDGKYANINAVTAPPKSVKVPPAVNPTVYYEIEDGASEVFQAFGDSLQGTIRNAPEWSGPADPDQRPSDEPGFGDDEIPF